MIYSGNHLSSSGGFEAMGKPFILETPNEDEGYAEEIAWVRPVMI